MASSFYLSSQVVQGRYMYLNCTQTKNVAENTSTVAWTLTVAGGESTYYTTGPTRIWLGDQLIYDKERVQWYSYQFPAARGSVSGVATVKHEQDGSAQIPVSITTMIYNGIQQTKSQNWVLDPIDRFALIREAADFTDEEDPVITYANFAGELVTSLQGCLSLDSETEFTPYEDIPKGENRHTFILSEAQREALREATVDSNTLPVYFLLRTVIGGNTGITSTRALMHIADPAPELEPQVEDINGDTLAVTGDAGVLVAGFSIARVRVNARAKKHASIVSVQVTQADTRLEGDGLLEPVKNGPIRIAVTDSRGNVTDWESEANILPYSIPACYIENTMPNGEGEMPMTVTGRFYSGRLGNGENTLKLQYRFRSGPEEYGPWIDLEDVRFNGDEFTAQTLVTGLDYRQTHIFQARATDRIFTGGSLSSPITVKAIPVFDWSQADFRFHVPVTAHRLTGLEEPEAGTDAVNKAYADGKLAKTGDSMAGELDMGNFRITGLGLPAQDTDAANKAYVDNAGGMVLLWQNASPASSFGEQTVMVDLQDYHSVLIYFSIYNASAAYWGYDMSAIAKVGKSHAICCHGETGSYPTTRAFTVKADRIEFGYAYYIIAIGGSLKWSSNLLRPIEIYGIKGVVTQ